MTSSLKRRGKKLMRKWSRASHRASVKSTEHLKENLVERLPNARNVRLLILEWSLLVVALIFLAATQALWYQNSDTTVTYARGGTYTEGTLGKINSLNPLFATTSSEETLSRLMFATLATTDYTGHTGLGLAESITHDETGKIWTVKLRDHLKWSDGEPITNRDVLFTVSLIQNPHVSTVYSPNLSGVKCTEADGKLIFTLAAPYFNFDDALVLPIVPEHILSKVDPAKIADAEFNTAPVSSGDFAYNATQNVEGEKIVFLAANPFSYKGKPLLDTFAVRSYANNEGIITALKTGVITATAELPANQTEAIADQNIYERQTAINSGVYAFLNTTSPALNNKTTRQAIRQGIDLSALREVLHGEQPLDYPILRDQLSLSEWPALPGHDPAAARTTLTNLGVISPDRPLQLATVKSGYLPEITNRLAAQLQNLGYQTNVSVYEPNQDFVSTVISQRNYDILVYEIELGTNPDLFAYYHSSQATGTGLNLSNYRNAIVDNALISVRTTANERLNNLKYTNFLNAWLDDVPAIGIYRVNLSYYLGHNIRSFSEDNILTEPTDRFTDVRNWGVIQTRKYRTP